jgi:cobalt-zinc-cadmium efflux system protein
LVGLVALATTAGFLFEFTAGLKFGSVSLLSDSIQMLFDVAVFSIAFLSGLNPVLESRLENPRKKAAVINALLLFPLAGFILWRAYSNFLDPSGLMPLQTVVSGLVILTLESIMIWKLESFDLRLSDRSALYTLMTDAAGTVAAITSALIVKFTGFRLIDPVFAVLIAAVAVFNSIRILARAHE